MDEIDKIKFKINHMQLDNYIKGTQFPVIISPVQKSNSFDIPLMSLQVIKRNKIGQTVLEGVNFFDDLVFQLNILDVRVDMKHLKPILALVTRIKEIVQE